MKCNCACEFIHTPSERCRRKDLIRIIKRKIEKKKKKSKGEKERKGKKVLNKNSRKKKIRKIKK